MPENSCIFCTPKEVVLSNDLAYVRTDSYPVNTGHLLVIPKRHIDNYFELSEAEKQALYELIDESKAFLDKEYSPDGYNVGVNVGSAAGQSVMHVHMHLIPRYKGDMANPKGGVRGVIPEKQKYKKLQKAS